MAVREIEDNIEMLGALVTFNLRQGQFRNWEGNFKGRDMASLFVIVDIITHVITGSLLQLITRMVFFSEKL